jgi:hypothetical protein
VLSTIAVVLSTIAAVLSVITAVPAGAGLVAPGAGLLVSSPHAASPKIPTAVITNARFSPFTPVSFDVVKDGVTAFGPAWEGDLTKVLRESKHPRN